MLTIMQLSIMPFARTGRLCVTVGTMLDHFTLAYCWTMFVHRSATLYNTETMWINVVTVLDNYVGTMMYRT